MLLSSGEASYLPRASVILLVASHMQASPVVW